jgi:hypothetical protein
MGHSPHVLLEVLSAGCALRGESVSESWVMRGLARVCVRVHVCVEGTPQFVPGLAISAPPCSPGFSPTAQALALGHLCSPTVRAGVFSPTLRSLCFVFSLKSVGPSHSACPS